MFSKVSAKIVSGRKEGRKEGRKKAKKIQTMCGFVELGPFTHTE
jgi:hypothetical protein